MSHYINSFLIEPVVRQARRFSRSNDEPEPRLDQDEVSASRHDGDALEASAVDTHNDGLVGEAELTGRNMNDELSRQHTSTRDEPLPDLIQDVQNTHLEEARRPHSRDGSLQSVEDASQRRRQRTRRTHLSREVDTSENPGRGTGELRSSISSTSSTDSARWSTISASGRRPQPPRSAASRDRHFGRPLPADDGMSQMRSRIIAIQGTDISSEEKARLMHGLMIEKHNASQQSLHGSNIMRTQSPISVQSLDRPFTPSSRKSMDSMRQTVSPPTSFGSNVESMAPFRLTTEDLTPTYFKRPYQTLKESGVERKSLDQEEESRALGCSHYKRNVKLQCSACFRWYTCRFCHDAVEDHMLNRKETKNMLCMLCKSAQPAAAECTSCAERGAWYYCDVCKLWDDDPHKSIYHCNDCGICRVGQGLGKDFFHCKVCIPPNASLRPS